MWLLSFVVLVLLVFALAVLVQVVGCRTTPVNWPVVGMGVSLLFNVHRIHDWGVDILRHNRGTFMFRGPWLLGLHFLMVSDPDDANHILSLNHSNYPKGDDFSQIFDVLGAGIFNANSDTWHYQRRKAHALLGSPRFRSSVAARTKEKVQNTLIPLLTDFSLTGVTVDLQDVFLRLTFDLTCSVVLGVDPGGLSPAFPTVPFSRAVNVAEEVILLRHTVPVLWWKAMRRLGVGPERRLASAVAVVDGFLLGHVTRIRAARVNGGKEHGMLSSYLDDEAEKANKIGDTVFLRDSILSLLAAGKDTTAAALTWLFYMLSEHPEVERKLLDELRGLKATRIHDGGGDVVFEAEELAGLVYLQAVLCETLRLYPPVPLNHKAALRADVLPSGHRVLPGTRIILSAHATARMEAVWGPDCAQFRPERWLSEKGRVRHEPSHKFSTFSSGPRSCLGRDLAFTQLRVVAAAMVYNFHVAVAEGNVVTPKVSLILHMRNGLMVRLVRRKWGPPRDATSAV